MKFTLSVALLFVHAISFAIPISPNLTAVFDQEKTAIKIKWQTNDPAVNTYLLQKSADNIKWVDIHVMVSNEFSSNKIEKYHDLQPDPNKNHYRLKMIKKDGVEFSDAITIIMGQTTNSWIIFPVPVTNVLNLQYTGSEPIKNVISVFIQNAQGKILHRLRTSSLNRAIQIPVANLGKGIYDVRIMIQDKVVWNQRFVK